MFLISGRQLRMLDAIPLSVYLNKVAEFIRGQMRLR